MLHPNPLDQLRSEYAALDLRPPTSLSIDHRRSLYFYRAERAMLACALMPQETPTRVIAWLLTLRRLEAFIAREMRWPRENRRLDRTAVTSSERRLAAWIRTQRTSEMLRCDYQHRRLECTNGFLWHPLDDRWHRRVDEYQFFTNAYRRAPLGRSDDPAERMLAGFAARTRLAHRRGHLTPSRMTVLKNLDFWTWGTTPRP
jgi:hypothetical protein